MAVIGIIAELNPLHTGHKLLIDEAKKHGTVVVALSSDFVQRGDVAIADKRTRATSALLSGADLVLELPVCYSMSTAQNFALGGVAALKAAGCDTLIFGSECGDIKALKNAARILKSEEFKAYLSSFLSDGITFAAARERAAEKCGLEGNILSGANNNLAVEYILAAESISAAFEFMTVTRKGAPHDSDKADSEYASASLLREKLKVGDYDFCEKYIPESIISLFAPEKIADIDRIDRAILSVLRLKTEEELKKLPDISEGIENKLFSAIGVAKTTDELYNTVKVKRYTHARIRRLVLSAFIGIDNELFMKLPPYIRVLGFNDKGIGQLSAVSKSSDIPLVTRISEITGLGDRAVRLFRTECRASDLYSMALKNPLPRGREYTEKIIKLK